MSRRHARRCCGFTLIEVLVTSTIAAMLITSILGVTLKLERHRRALAQQYQYHGRSELLRRTLDDDLIQCTALSIRPNQVELSGPLSTNREGSYTLQPAEIRYVLDPDGNLYRNEQTREFTKRDLLWIGASELHVTATGLTDSQIPINLRLVLTDDRDRTILDLTTLHSPSGGM